MRYALFLIFFFPIIVNAQKVEVLLIGVSHNYGNYPQQDFSGIHNKIKKFKPTAFFGEFLSKKDEQNVMDYWCKKENLRRIEILKKNRAIAEEALPKTIDSLKKLAIYNPKDYRLKTDLAHVYYLNQDVANGHYQYWQVFDYLQKSADIKLEDYVNKILSPKLDTVGRSMKRLKTSEYAFIAFPMMKELGIGELIAMDCQDYDLNWGASWGAFDAKFNVFKKDTSAIFRNELKANLNAIQKGFEKYDSIEKTSKNVTEWLNTDEAAKISASGDFYLPEMYTMKNFPKQEMLSKIHWWMMRNIAMCNNVVNHARAQRAEKVVVIAGANHRKYMQDLFEKMPHVTVRNINEIK
ncbi:DUF5694 domain-containing protein [Pedobacter rhizosphaerae]|uniref:Uncharacterized protein n=1 Tax=Pedobacter rhizosphaerae TaxID=390241 RepID=A0A1H9VE92_9SPHI|nr:DUF5694 domain-containing protein [Pedobacter rhizosphaerae]SES19613.1 hypothetical protein SAMN04488023_14132 [Pedobacter rhizosphaerae]